MLIATANWWIVDFLVMSIFITGLDDIATVGEDSATTSSYALDLNDNSDSEKEDEVIRPDDNLLLVGHVDNDFNSLEVWVHNEENQDFYIHHDVLIPSFPLCLEWLNHDVTTGNWFSKLGT